MNETIKAAKQTLHRIQEQAARDHVKERKARTHRLITEGAVLEKVMPFVAAMKPTELEAFLREVFRAVTGQGDATE